MRVRFLEAGLENRKVRLTASAKATAVRRFDFAEATSNPPKLRGGGSFTRRRKPDTTKGTETTATALVAIVASLTLALAPEHAPRAQESPILAAMQDELKRSMADLRLKDEPPPYYIAYQIDDASATRVSAQLGAIVTDTSGRSRTLRVEVRVGDYAFDSSRFVSQDRGGGLVPLSAEAVTSVALDDDYAAMRRQMWLLTDVVYKRAVTAFARKKAAFQDRAGTESIPDFSREPPEETLLPPLRPAPANRDWVDRVRQISAVFASSPEIQTSEVSLSDTRGTRYYVNSEGFRVVVPVQSASLRVAAETQADDGMVLRDAFSLVENSLQDLPAVSELVARSRALAGRVSAQRTAALGEEYTGPVLLLGPASAELVAQTLVPLMLARRAPDADSARVTQLAQSQMTPYLSRIGLRVLPDSFSVSDTPSLTEYGGRPVPGAYAADDEGVPAKDVTLVEKGRLLTLLMGRTPHKNLPQSNGHGRGGSVQAGVFQVRSTQAVPASELKTKYLELLKLQSKSFGYIVRAIANPADIPGGGGPGGPIILQAAKVTLDGNEESVRGLRFATIGFAAFRDILEASEERLLHSYRDRAGGNAIVSVIVPSLMFEELEIQKTTDIAQKPPIVPSPLKS